MAETDPLSSMFNLFAAPLAGAVQSVEQFRNGVDQFQRGVENFNRTMENLNETAERINTLLGEVEEPLRAAVPQVTRTVKTADEMMKVVSGPAMAVAPGLQILAETLENPAFRQMPSQMAQLNEVLGEVTSRLAPLGQLAESAGGLFGGFKLPGFGSGGSDSSERTAASTPKPAADPDPAKIKKTAARKRSASKKKAATKRTAAAKTPTKKKSGS